MVNEQGKIDGLLHAAGISSVTPLKLVKPEMYERFFTTNVSTSIELTKEITRMGNYTKGACGLVYFASIMGVVGEKGKTLYSATKGALISAARSLSLELASKGVRVNTVSPGAILTPINASQPYRLTLRSAESLKISILWDWVDLRIYHTRVSSYLVTPPVG